MLVARLRPGVSHERRRPNCTPWRASFAAEGEAKGGNMAGWDLNLSDSAHFERGLFGVIGEQWPAASGRRAASVDPGLHQYRFAAGAARGAAAARDCDSHFTGRHVAPHRFATVHRGTSAGVDGRRGGMGGQPGAGQIALRAAARVLDSPWLSICSTDWRILGLVAVLVMLVALLCGMMPIRQALRSSQRDALYEGGQAILGSSRNRWVKIASLGTATGALLRGAGRLGVADAHAAERLHRARGFDRENAITAQFSLSRSGYTKEKGLAFQAALLDRVAQCAGGARSHADDASAHGR